MVEELQSVFGSAEGPPSFEQVEKVFFPAAERIPLAEWTSFAHFDLQSYSRNLLAAQAGPASFSLILLCWEPGQTTPVHSHASADSAAPPRRSWGFVIEGDLLMVNYSDTLSEHQCRQISSPPQLYNRSNPCLREASPRGFHVLQNLNCTRRAMSLHLYSPAFLDCCWETQGHTQHSLPVSYTPVCPGAIQSTYQFMGLLPSFFTSFDSLAGIVASELSRGKDIERMIRIFKSLRFNPKEFQRYAHWTSGKYTRNLIGYNSEFTLLMLCWDRGQESPIHDHAGSHCFMKILEGELHEVRYDASNPSRLALKKITQLRDEAVAYIDDTQGVHKMVNPSSEHGAISLHIYIPPYSKCSIFNLALGERRCVDMASANSYTDKPFTPMELNASFDQAPIITVESLVRILEEFFASSSAAAAASLPSQTIQIQKILDRVHFISNEWQTHVHFSDHNYTRMLLKLTPTFSRNSLSPLSILFSSLLYPVSNFNVYSSTSPLF